MLLVKDWVNHAVNFMDTCPINIYMLSMKALYMYNSYYNFQVVSFLFTII